MPNHEPSAGAPPPDVPLFVDLDGTLVRTDLLYEAFLDRVKRDWALPLRATAWLAGGRAALKTRLAEGHALSVATLPYDDAVLDHIRAARAGGRRVVLATASHRLLAQPVADHLGLFDGVIATEAGRNVSGHGKLARLREACGSDRFEYLGNGAADIAIWDAGTHAGVVAPDGPARRWMARNAGKARAVGVHASARDAWRAHLRVLQPRRWLWNLLLAVPLVAAHRVSDRASLLQVAIGFVAFSIGALALGVVDDLLDLDADRVHPRKRLRPFASGAVPLAFGVRVAPVLLLAALGVGAAVSWAFDGVLAAYVVVALAHGLSLRRTAAIDAVTLAALAALRVVAGAVAIRGMLG